MTRPNLAMLSMAFAIAFGGATAHATAHGGIEATKPAIDAGGAPIQLAANNDDEKRRRENENKELTRKLKEERERAEHERKLKQEQWRIIRQGCKYGQGKC